MPIEAELSRRILMAGCRSQRSILRNQIESQETAILALYRRFSSLVEMLFPNHVRLSIHFHNNAGPKFGIQLYDPTVVQVVKSLSENGLPTNCRDLLHISTPWHNCVVEVAASRVLYVTKARVARDAVIGKTRYFPYSARSDEYHSIRIERR
ncbi:hypothetical protein AAE478_009778 [Parahypoxylon ruwenzoriense]